MALVLLLLASSIASCFSFDMCKVYYRRECKPTCGFQERKVGPAILCRYSGKGQACCVPSPTTTPPPPISDGGWGPWTSFDECLGACDSARQYYYRVCLTAKPCVGERLKSDKCVPSNCVTSAPTAWDSWGDWSPCSVTCGAGSRWRRRNCKNLMTTQIVSSDRCDGSDIDTEDCSINICPDKECGKPRAVPRILGGSDATICQWPWMVHFKFRISGVSMTACSGVLVDKNSVVTTGACAFKLKSSRQVNISTTVTVADLDASTTDGGRDVNFTEIITHPEYKDDLTSLAEPLTANNLAVIQLNNDMKRGQCENYVCLPDAYRNVSLERCMFAGWGSTSAVGPDANVLQQASANLIDTGLCKFYYEATGGYNGEAPFEENFLCGGIRGNPTLACSGDEGGMLVCPDTSTAGFQWTLKGLNQPSGCDSSKPNLFVSVTSKIDWIRETMKKND